MPRITPARIAQPALELEAAFRRFCQDGGHVTATSIANASEACGYRDWLEANNRLRFGTDNRLTRHAVLGAMHRLRHEGSIGIFFYFFHANEPAIMQELGIAETDPLRVRLSQALANAIAAHPDLPPRGRASQR